MLGGLFVDCALERRVKARRAMIDTRALKNSNLQPYSMLKATIAFGMFFKLCFRVHTVVCCREESGNSKRTLEKLIGSNAKVVKKRKITSLLQACFSQ